MQELLEDTAGTSPPFIPKSPDVEMISSFEKSGESNDVSLRDESLAESFKSMYHYNCMSLTSGCNIILLL